MSLLHWKGSRFLNARDEGAQISELTSFYEAAKDKEDVTMLWNVLKRLGCFVAYLGSFVLSIFNIQLQRLFSRKRC